MRRLAGPLTAIVLLGASGCGASHHPVPAPRPAPPPAAAPAAAPPIKGPAGGLAIGLTELEPALLRAPPEPVPPPFRQARALLAALAPQYLRVDVDWAAVQPSPDESDPSLDRIESGCDRGSGPCAAYRGLDATLKAIASERSAQGAAPQVVVVIFNAPRWATRSPSGCMRAAAPAGAHPLTAAGLRAYGRLVLAILSLGRRDGVRLGWWSAWDEPNHPLFLSPQRRSCSRSSPSLAPGAYVALVRTLADALHRGGGNEQIVLGDLADFASPGADATGIAEFVRGLPPDVLCLSSVWAQHLYPRGGVAREASAEAPGGNIGDLALLERALERRGPCGRRMRIWVTETGAGDPHAGGAALTAASSLATACRLMAGTLLAFYRDPRVDVAFQYTFREDTLFPVGLMSADLSRVYPTYQLLRAWSARTLPSEPPPALPEACR